MQKPLLIHAAVSALICLAACGDDSASGGGGEAAGGAATGAGGSGGSSSDGAGGAGGAGGGGEACLPEEVGEQLGDLLEQLITAKDLLSGHASASETAGFFLAPGLPQPPGLVGSFDTLAAPCTDPVSLPEVCDEGRCAQLECLGGGPGWSNHLSFDAAPFTADPFTFEGGQVNVSWVDGNGFGFDLLFESSGPGGDWSLSGGGVMDLELLTVEITLPYLFEQGVAKLEAQADAGGASGTFKIGGVVVAEVQPTGALEATVPCP